MEMVETDDGTRCSRQQAVQVPALHNVLKIPGCLLGIAFFGPYFVVLMTGNMKKPVPMISDNIARQPFSGFFSFVNLPASICGILGYAIFYAKIELLNQQINNERHKTLEKVSFTNKVNLCLGVFTYIGLTLGAAFPLDREQENSEWLRLVYIAHTIGALLTCIGFFLTYTVSTYLLSSLQVKKIHFLGLRKFFIAIMGILETIGMLCIVTFFLKKDGDAAGSYVISRYLSVSTCEVILPLSEWILSIIFLVFSLIMSKDVEDIKVIIHIAMDDTTELNHTNHTENKQK